MNINQYPDEIAKQELRIMRTDRKIRKLEEYLASLYAAIDLEIAFDPELKNDAQRKAKKQQMISESIELITAGLELQEAKDKKVELDINLQLLRNQFSVIKLEKRESIALLELQAASQ